MECDSMHCCIETVAERWGNEGREKGCAERGSGGVGVGGGRWKWTWTAGGQKKRHWEIDRDKRKEIIERTLHYCWSSSPLESVYLLSRQEICYWQTGGGTMRWIPLKSTTPLMSQHVRNHHLFNYLLHLYLRFYLWLFPPPLFIPCLSAVLFSGSGKSWVLPFLIRPHYDNSHKDVLAQ